MSLDNPINLESPDFNFASLVSDGGVFKNAFSGLSKGFGSGLNIFQGITGMVESSELDGVTEDELNANLQQDEDLQQQNVQSYISTSAASFTKLSGVLGNLRAASAGLGVKMDGSGMVQEMTERNLSAESKDQLASSLNYSFEDQKIRDRMKAAIESANAQEDSDFFGGLGSFFSAGAGVAGIASLF